MRVYVKDFILAVRLGVHDRERLGPQRVRFEVSVDLAEQSGGDGYFSYDAIVDAIRSAASAGHVDLAEQLAEAIAARILADRRALRVTVRVEKLEVIGGVLGIERVFEQGGG